MEKVPLATDSAPPPYDSPPPQQQQPQLREQPVVVTTPHPVVANVSFKDMPTMVHCPHCNNDVISETSFRVGLLAWLIMGIVFFVGMNFFLCCLCPFVACFKSVKDVDHTCPVCQYHLGKYERGRSI